MIRFGLLGAKLSHSYSKIIQEFLMKKNNYEASYDLLEISEDSIEKSLSYIKNGIYKGFNVTIPYKEKVIPFLDELTTAAKEIGAVNTIYLKEGKLVGDNTDYIGFMKELEFYKINVSNRVPYVLGSGGASKAICYAFKMLGLTPVIVSRNTINGLTYAEIQNINRFDMIVNTTPVGMYPNVDASPLEESVVKKSDVVIDLIFNPKVTKLLSYSNEGYNGLVMLIYQAIYALRTWLNKDLDYDIDEIIKLIEEGA